MRTPPLARNNTLARSIVLANLREDVLVPKDCLGNALWLRLREISQLARTIANLGDIDLQAMQQR